MKELTAKLEKLAKLIDEDKGLDFLGLVHRTDTLDRWDLMISSPRLESDSLDALRYVADRLLKVLGKKGILMIAGIVALPRKSEVLAQLSEDDRIRPGRVSTLSDGMFDRVLLIRPLDPEHAAAGNGKRA